MVIIKIANVPITIQDLVVRSKNKTYRDAVRVLAPVNGASPSDPDPDLSLAEAAVKSLGAVIVFHQRPPATRPGRVF